VYTSQSLNRIKYQSVKRKKTRLQNNAISAKIKAYSSTDVYGINRPFQKHSKIGLFPLAAFSSMKQSSSSSSSFNSASKG
jgi:hypothetical protein